MSIKMRTNHVFLKAISSVLFVFSLRIQKEKLVKTPCIPSKSFCVEEMIRDSVLIDLLFVVFFTAFKLYHDICAVVEIAHLIRVIIFLPATCICDRMSYVEDQKHSLVKLKI